MPTVAIVISILGGLVLIAGFATVVTVNSRAGGQAEALDRARKDRDDYKDRVEFIEPRLSKALEENELLQRMHNPAERLGAIKSDTAAILALLRAQATEIGDAKRKAEGS